MPSFDETKAIMDDLYGGNLEYSTHAFNAFATPRTPSRVERAFTTKLPRTALMTAAVGYSILAARVNLPR